MTTHDIAEFLVGSVFIIAGACLAGIFLAGLALMILNAKEFISGDRSDMPCVAVASLFIIITYLSTMTILHFTK